VFPRYLLIEVGLDYFMPLSVEKRKNTQRIFPIKVAGIKIRLVKIALKSF
jgi:hypothetical protein